MKQQLDSRDQELSRVYRWVGSPASKRLIYRPTLLEHTARVARTAMQIAKDIGLTQDEIDKVYKLALYHDDVEILTGDIISMERESMESDRQGELILQTEQAIDVLIRNYGNLLGDDYAWSLQQNLEAEKKDLERPQGNLLMSIATYADKFDSVAEATHEILGGNGSFLPPESSFKTMSYISEKLSTIKARLIQQLGFTPASPFLDITGSIKSEDEIFAQMTGPHNEDTFFKTTGLPGIDAWREHHRFLPKDDPSYQLLFIPRPEEIQLLS